jgi:hypothetical protein
MVSEISLKAENLIFMLVLSRNCLRKGSRCDFSKYPERPIPTAYEITSMGKLLAEISMAIDETTPLEFLPLLKHPSPTQPVEDLRMTHHVSQITTELQKNGGHLMSHGTSVLPKSVFTTYRNGVETLLITRRFLELAARHSFVKHALLGLATAHLNFLVKLTELERLG